MLDSTHHQLTTDEMAQLRERYELIEAIGHGGMGLVFRGHDQVLNRPVALKLCKPNANVSRLHREAIAMAGIQSRHVVSVHDFLKLGQNRGVLIMDWIDGQDLATMMQDSSVSLKDEIVRQWMRDVCTGMIDAEAQGVIHRDLKPSNIIIDTHQRALVMDFGIATGQRMNQLTMDGEVIGTPLYMAPEQVENPSNVDTRADVYSFGATFYHAIVRQPPFDAENPWSVVWKHKTEPLIPPKSRNPLVSGVLNDCIERCLAKDPADRFSSFSQINEVLSSSGIQPWEHTLDKTLANYLGIFKIHRKHFLSPETTELDQPTIFDFPNKRRLKVLFGDLTEQAVDVLVSSDDAMLTMSSGVSAALAKKAGGSFQEEAQRFTPIRAGRAVVTAAGDLPSRFVFHGISIGIDGESRQFPTRDVIAEIVDSCFYQAETLSITSIAFPLLGTGNAGLSRGTALDTMFRIIAHRLLRRASSIKEVRIVLWPHASPSEDITLS